MNLLHLSRASLLACALLPACVPTSEPIGETWIDSATAPDTDPPADTAATEPAADTAADTVATEPPADTDTTVATEPPADTDTGGEDTGGPEGPAPLACGFPEVCPTGDFFCDVDPCEYQESTLCVLARLESGEAAELATVALFEPGGETTSTWVLAGDKDRTVLVQHASEGVVDGPKKFGPVMSCKLQPPDYFSACAAKELDCFYVTEWVTDCTLVEPVVCPAP